MCLKQKFKISFSKLSAFVLGEYSLIIHYLDIVNLIMCGFLHVSLFEFSKSLFSPLLGHHSNNIYLQRIHSQSFVAAPKYLYYLENSKENVYFPYIDKHKLLQ